MKKQIHTFLGVCCVVFIFALASSGTFASLDRTSHLQGHQDCVEQEDRGSNGHSQRLSGPSRPSEAEYTPQEAAKTPAEAEVGTLFFQPNCMILWTAEWCPACKSMYPVAKILQAEGYTVYILDYDQNKALAKKMRVQYFPTTLIHRYSVEVTRRTGIITLEEIKRDLKKNYYDIW